MHGLAGHAKEQVVCRCETWATLDPVCKVDEEQLHGGAIHAEEKSHSGVDGRMKKNGPSRLAG